MAKLTKNALYLIEKRTYTPVREAMERVEKAQFAAREAVVAAHPEIPELLERFRTLMLGVEAWHRDVKAAGLTANFRYSSDSDVRFNVEKFDTAPFDKRRAEIRKLHDDLELRMNCADSTDEVLRALTDFEATLTTL